MNNQQDLNLQKALFSLINKKKITRSLAGDILRVALGKPLPRSTGADRRKSQISRGARRLFVGLFWNLFAVSEDLRWKKNSGRFQWGYRWTSHKELMALTGCTVDEIRENLEMLEHEARFIKRDLQKHPPRDAHGWETDLFITLLPDAVRAAAQKLKGLAKKRGKTRRPKHDVASTSETPEAMYCRLAATLLQHSTSWSISVEDLLYELKKQKSGSQDQRKARASEGSINLLNWLIGNCFHVDEYGGWTKDAERVDERGFKIISLSEYRELSGCSMKQLRLARTELQDFQILEETHQGADECITRDLWVRVNFPRLVILFKELAPNFRIYPCLIVRLTYPENQDNFKKKASKSCPVFDALIPQSFPLEDGEPGVRSVAHTPASSTEMKRERGALLYFLCFFRKKRIRRAETRNACPAENGCQTTCNPSPGRFCRRSSETSPGL